MKINKKAVAIGSLIAGGVVAACVALFGGKNDDNVEADADYEAIEAGETDDEDVVTVD